MFFVVLSELKETVETVTKLKQLAKKGFKYQSGPHAQRVLGPSKNLRILTLLLIFHSISHILQTFLKTTQLIYVQITRHFFPPPDRNSKKLGGGRGGIAIKKQIFFTILNKKCQ